MKKFFILLCAIAMIGGVSSCKQKKTEKAEPCPITLNDEQRQFVDGNNSFSLSFLKEMDDWDINGKSFVYSPLSITYVLSMVNDAAEGITSMEMQNTLGFGIVEKSKINDFCKILIDSLPMADRNIQLQIANAVFVNKDYTLKKQFLQNLNKYYSADAESLDFSSRSAASSINKWCKKQTNGLIPQIIEKTNPNFVSYLLNAVYFKAEWAEPFEESDTETDTFYTADGYVMLPLMHQHNRYSYVQNQLFAAVDIPYGNGQWSMTVVLPEEGKDVSDVIDFLSKEHLAFLDTLRERSVDLKLPRFETKSSTEGYLIDIMQNMGIRYVFDKDLSDVPNMCDRNVYIGMMKQDARIMVNEEGSEAAAVTIVGIAETTCALMPEEPVLFYANRPFVYIIREASTNAILFVGRYTGK